MATGQTFKIGTRGSPLALAQAHETVQRLSDAHGMPQDLFEVVIIKTTGDRIQDRPLGEIGGKGLFTKEIEEALVNGAIDCAVHSMKDVPVQRVPGLMLDCYLPREDVRDAFISLTVESLHDLPQKAVVGSSSLRRRAQVSAVRPDLALVEFRGNVQTRLKKLENQVADGTFLAMAGLSRLGLIGKIPAFAIETTDMLPAVAQGAIGIEVREADTRTHDLLRPLNDNDTEVQLQAERAFLKGLDGSCQTPIAALATLNGNDITLRGQVIKPDGTESYEKTLSGQQSEAGKIGTDLADWMKGKIGTDFFSG